jgi:hypothetical protein
MPNKISSIAREKNKKAPKKRLFSSYKPITKDNIQKVNARHNYSKEELHKMMEFQRCLPKENSLPVKKSSEPIFQRKGRASMQPSEAIAKLGISFKTKTFLVMRLRGVESFLKSEGIMLIELQVSPALRILKLVYRQGNDKKKKELTYEW